MQIINAILSLIPLIKPLLDLFIKTPEEKRAELIVKLKKAFERAILYNTEDIEDIINGDIKP